MTGPESSRWVQGATPLTEHVLRTSRGTLESYRIKPDYVAEHFGIEQSIRDAGYGHRQLFELAQNAADAITEHRGSLPGFCGRVVFILSANALYCANEGAPIDTEGASCILASHMSPKKGAAIGHFGLGVKSLLAVSSRPEFFSTSGSFAFDEAWAAMRIREIVPGASQTPTLRIARTLDIHEAALTDPVLHELMPWASTIVRLTLDRPAAEGLADDLERFPAEFLLFSPQVRQLILDNRLAPSFRELHVTTDGPLTKISQGNSTESWRIFSTEIPRERLPQTSPAYALDRDWIPLLWAVPLRDLRKPGQIWAFFPTAERTTLSGILNAPWQTGASRDNLLEGDYNACLVRRAAALVSSAMPLLSSSDDPGALLDVLPARDTKSWLDELLAADVTAGLAGTRCVPDMAGVLCRPNAVRLRPMEATQTSLIEFLRSEPETRPEMCHISVETRERRARAERIGVVPLSLAEWLTGFVSTCPVSGSRYALRVIAELYDGLSPLALHEVKSLPLVATGSGGLLSANDPRLLIVDEGVIDDPAVQAVHEDLSREERIRAVLLRLGVQQSDPVLRVRLVLRALANEDHRYCDWQGGPMRLRFRSVEDALEPCYGASPTWAAFWPASRQCSVEAVCAELNNFIGVRPCREYSERDWNAAAGIPERLQGINWTSPLSVRERLCVRTLSGRWRPLYATCLPGPVTGSGGDACPRHTIDTTYHAADMPLLMALGACAAPGGVQCDALRQTRGSWVALYLSEMRMRFVEHSPANRRPRASQVMVEDLEYPSLLELLRARDCGCSARLTALLLDLATREPRYTVRHETQPIHGTLEVEGPVQWMVRRHGQVHTSRGISRTRDAAGPGLERWRDMLPVAICTAEQAKALELPEDLDAVAADVAANALEDATAADLPTYGAFCAAVCHRLPAPRKLRCIQDGVLADVLCERVVAVHDESTYELMQSAGEAVLPAGDFRGARLLHDNWGLRLPEYSIGYSGAASPEPVLDRLPLLARHEDALGSLTTTACEALWFEVSGTTGSTRHEVRFARQGDRFFYLGDISDEELARLIKASIGLRDAPASPDGGQALPLPDVSQIPDLPSKLLGLIGPTRLRAGLPSHVLELLRKENVTSPAGRAERDLALARLALAVHGIDVLRKYQDALRDAGFEVPRQWAGSPRALDLVQHLGFPREYAGFQVTALDPTIEVDGLVPLKPLHDYQERLVTRLLDFLSESPAARGLLSLPTGAGKTRIAVEALIRVSAQDSRPALVLWVAQTEELCEQAVQSWREAWRSLGPPQTLRISRLWGATNNRVVPFFDAHHVVVATYHSLAPRLSRPSHAWLRDATQVVIDEAHGSIAPVYTEMLESLGFSRAGTSRPLLGLTATPFRGSEDPEETRRLVSRYQGRRFDHGLFPDDDAHSVLQRRKVLSNVEHEVLEGTIVTLTQPDLEHMEQYRVVSPAIEQFLATDTARNDRIADSIAAKDVAWPILVFAASVTHAEYLAAALTLRGIEARPISAHTEPATRRHYIEAFRAGRLRVLTNYNVLTTGFDAPAVRALYVARPVFSRVLYQQMIGRGLRGPLNGGTETCLIVNVADNFINYGERLAFHHFEHLWTT